ncbi:MAG: CPBP family intramembrane metalloprotease [Anaerolineales bacterium]|nr:MAG: CPBP family intramembrane metalloprotease [Anaerolineales bacterium]
MQKKILGLSLSLAVPVVFVLFISPMFIKPNVNEPLSTLVGFGVFWGLAFAVLVFTRKTENLPLTTIGWNSLSWKSALMAIGFGVLLSLLVPVLTLLVSAIFPPSNSGTVTQVVSNYSWWILFLSVITAGITEEILFRGYSLERLLEVTGNKWISGLISLVFFVAVHATGWNIAHIVGVVVPLGMILTGLYFWQRNVFFVIIVHVVIDLPLVIMALLA